MPLTPILFDDLLDAPRFIPDVRALKVERIDEPGTRLDVAYNLLARVFDPAVLDSKQTYLEQLSSGGLCLDGFPLICVAALFEHGSEEILAGFLSSNLMWIDRSKGLLQLAIGNIGTSPKLIETGFRGVGTALLNSAIELGKSFASSCSAELSYSVAEAELASLGFWKKRGYLWPEGLKYLQPPLEFDASGDPIHEEVPETFLCLPLAKQSSDTIETSVLRQMIQSIYRNWCIEKNRAELSPDALRRAEKYVLDRVFNQVVGTIGNQQTLRLVNVPAQQFKG